MTEDETEKWTLGRNAMVGTLWAAWLCMFMLIYAIIKGRDASVMGDAFAALSFIIFSTLGVMVGGKGWKDFASMKFGTPRTEQTTTVKTVEVSNAPPANALPVSE